MKIREFITESCKRKNICVNVELAVDCLVDPACDLDHDLTQEEMATIEEFIDRFCDGLTSLVRQASSTASRILRQKVNYEDAFDSVNQACRWLWNHNYEKDEK